MKSVSHRLGLVAVLGFLLSLQPVQAQQTDADVPAPEIELIDLEQLTDPAAEDPATAAEELAVKPSETAETPEETALPAKMTLGGRNISAYTRKNLVGGTSIGGYFDTEYYFPDGKNSFFDNHRLILQVSSLVHERIFFNTEIELEHGGILGTGTDDGALKVEQATLDFQLEDWLIFRGGVILVPVGRLNVLHDSDFRDTTARPLFTRVIVPSTWMEPGAGFYGTVYPDEHWEIFYEAYVLQGLTDGLSDGNGLRGARPSLGKDNNQGKALTTRVGLSPFIGLELGLGGYYSAFDTAGNKHLGMLVADLNWSHGPFEVLGEAGVVLHSPTTYRAGEEDIALDGSMWGYYLEGHYHFFPEFLKGSWLESDLSQPVFTLVGRVSQVDTDTRRFNQNDRTELVLGLNYRPIPSTVFKVEYQWLLNNEAVSRGDWRRESHNNQLIASVAVGF